MSDRMTRHRPFVTLGQRMQRFSRARIQRYLRPSQGMVNNAPLWQQDAGRELVWPDEPMPAAPDFAPEFEGYSDEPPAIPLEPGMPRPTPPDLAAIMRGHSERQQAEGSGERVSPFQNPATPPPPRRPRPGEAKPLQRQSDSSRPAGTPLPRPRRRAQVQEVVRRQPDPAPDENDIDFVENDPPGFAPSQQFVDFATDQPIVDDLPGLPRLRQQPAPSEDDEASTQFFVDQARTQTEPPARPPVQRRAAPEMAYAPGEFEDLADDDNAPRQQPVDLFTALADEGLIDAAPERPAPRRNLNPSIEELPSPRPRSESERKSPPPSPLPIAWRGGENTGSSIGQEDSPAESFNRGEPPAPQPPIIRRRRTPQTPPPERFDPRGSKPVQRQSYPVYDDPDALHDTEPMPPVEPSNVPASLNQPDNDWPEDADTEMMPTYSPPVGRETPLPPRPNNKPAVQRRAQHHEQPPVYLPEMEDESARGYETPIDLPEMGSEPVRSAIQRQAAMPDTPDMDEGYAPDNLPAMLYVDDEGGDTIQLDISPPARSVAPPPPSDQQHPRSSRELRVQRRANVPETSANPPPPPAEDMGGGDVESPRAEAGLLHLLGLPADTPVAGADQVFGRGESFNNAPSNRSAPSIQRAIIPTGDDDMDALDDNPSMSLARPSDTARSRSEAPQRTPVSSQPPISRSESALVSREMQAVTPESAPESAPPGEAGENGQQPGSESPDVEKLARDVYDLLRERLRIEQERKSGRL